MNKRAQHHDAEKWVTPPVADTPPELGYAEWLAAEIKAGCKELDAGQGIPTDEV